MDTRQRVLVVAGLLAVLAVVAILAVPPIQFVNPGPYENTSVTVVDENGTALATVDVRVADTTAKRRVGLRRTETLSDGEGMLFVHASDGEKPYIMPPSMSFPLDIVFVAPDGTIRAIRHAAVPADDTTLEYPGRGKYVLEVPRGYTNRTGIAAGDTVEIPAAYAEPAGG
ncbi:MULTISPECIES: DUF192 domain-containing protein [Salinibaculum]|uniref:DUF192 domain-containing protein n=1 Tax=Salinibaculum TaxID=2732368 RepID=UPI0030CEB9BB